MNKSTLVLASKINAYLLRGYNDYLEACESYRRDGFRPHYCEHGTNNWTDYDNICGGCEDGRTMGDPMQRMEYALDSAKRREAQVKAVCEAAMALSKLVPNIDLKPAWAEVERLLKVE